MVHQMLEVAKLATHSAAEVRSLRSITMQRLLLPTDSPLASMMVSARRLPGRLPGGSMLKGTRTGCARRRPYGAK